MRPPASQPLADTAPIRRVPRIAELATLTAVIGAIVLRHRHATALRNQREAWQGQLHHRVIPPLLAAERELARGEVGRARDLVQEAAGQSRGLLAHPDQTGHADAIIRDAMTVAKRIWGSDLLIEEGPGSASAPRLPRSRCRLLHQAVLEALNNVARHQPGARTRITAGDSGGYLTVTVAARRAPRTRPQGANRPITARSAKPAPDPPGGFGLHRLRVDVARQGGRMATHFAPDRSVVTVALPRTRFARWRRAPLEGDLSRPTPSGRRA